jgi:phosphoribosyl 1,2-cyclic phosphodiesterase
MRLTFWGVRGSIPAPGKTTVKYGGNTSCIEVYIKERDQVIILDAGTGIRELGNSLLSRYKPGKLSCNIFLTHTHWDHVQGFPFFAPAFIGGNSFNVYGPITSSINDGNQKPYLSLKDLFIEQMRYQYFPVKLDEMKAESKFKEIKEGHYEIDGLKIQTKTLNHPVLCIGYRFSAGGSSGDLVYCTDSEPYVNYFLNNSHEMPDDLFDPVFYENLKSKLKDPIGIEKLSLAMQENLNLVNFCRDARALIYDSQYKKEEYPGKINWGHSRIDDAVSVACRARVATLYLFHHEPTRSDSQIEDMLSYARELAVSRFNNKTIKIEAAEEGSTFEL